MSDCDFPAPAGWLRCRLGHMLAFNYGKSLPANTRDNSGKFEVFGSNGVVGHHSVALITGPTIVIGRKGSAGAVEWSSGDCWPIDTTYYVERSNHYNLRFAFYLLKHLRLSDLDRSTAVPGLNRDDAYALDISLPPLAEQERIVEKIETLFAELDKGEEALRAVQKLLARYRQSVLKAAVTGTLTADWRATNAPTDWQTTTLGSIQTFLTSGSRGWAQYYADAGQTFIRAQNIKHDRLDLTDVAFVDLPERAEGTRTMVREGDLLITITGANVTKTALVDTIETEAYVSQHVALFRPAPSVHPKYLHYFLVADSGGRKQLEAAAYGAGKPGLNLQNIKDVTINLPSLDEQQEIADRLDRQMAVYVAVERQLTKELKRSAAVRQSILKDAFSGKLVQQDPNDEPASELLARIQASRMAAPKRTRRKAMA